MCCARQLQSQRRAAVLAKSATFGFVLIASISSTHPATMAASLSSFFTEWTKAKVRAGSTQSCNACQCLFAARLFTVLRF